MSEQIIDGYVLGHQLGAGGYGAVFRGEKDGVVRAVKLFPGLDDSVLETVSSEERAHRLELRKIFLREGRRQAEFEGHPNIVQVYGVVDSPPAIILEYMAGGSLADRLMADDSRFVGNVSESLRVTMGVLNALNALHEKKLVHRDVKPGNILLSEDYSQVKLGDFGIVARFSSEELTTLGSEVKGEGTPHYRAPEQNRREPSYDERSDVFSAGMTLYHMLCGALPSSTGTIHPAQINKRVSKNLDAVVSKAIEYSPDKRWSSASQFYDALEPIFKKEKRKAHIVSPNDRVARKISLSGNSSFNSRSVISYTKPTFLSKFAEKYGGCLGTFGRLLVIGGVIVAYAMLNPRCMRRHISDVSQGIEYVVSNDD